MCAQTHEPPGGRLDGLAEAPIRLAANQPPRPYRGGAGIARLRGGVPIDDFRPEDFIASMTEVYGGHGVGLSQLDAHTLLRDAIAEDPAGFLGPEHVACWGADSSLLVKLLDTGERLFVHYHPTAEFAAEQLGATRGKNEAWVVIGLDPGTAEGSGCAYLGFHRQVTDDELTDWVARQDSAAMLAAMNRLALGVGDVLFVPAGVPHAIGPGVTLIELQEPSDLSILLEYRGFDRVDPATALLGLDLTTAVSGVDRRAFGTAELTGLIRPAAGIAELLGRPLPLLPPAAEAYFRAELLAPSSSVELDQGMSILIVLAGTGVLGWHGGELPVTAGDTVLIPYGVGVARLHTDPDDVLRAIRCRPSAPR